MTTDSHSPAAMMTQLQALVELEKASLARELHDELGGSLIASVMDVTLLRQRFSSHSRDSLQKFDRLARMLNEAIDVLRRITEELQPTLLDNVGLFAALRWQVRRVCLRSKVTCSAHLPDVEPKLPHAGAIMLFRAGQEALAVAANHPGVTHVDFRIEVIDDLLSMNVIADGDTAVAVEDGLAGNALGFLLHRTDALRGKAQVSYPPAGGLHLSAQVLLDHARDPTVATAL